MKHSRKIQTAVVLILAMLSVAAVVTRRQATKSSRQSRFAVTDTAAVTEVRLTNATGSSLQFCRRSGEWYVDNKYQARFDMMQAMLKVLHDISMSRIVSKTDFERIARQMAESGIEVEVCRAHRTLIAYTLLFGIDGNCYAMRRGAGQPFIIEVPGYNQLLPVLAISDIRKWRSRTLIAIEPDQLVQVVYIDGSDPKKSFILRQNAGKFKLSTYPDEQPVDNINIEKTARYAAQFRSKKYQTEAELQPAAVDSVLNTQPLFTLTVTSPDTPPITCTAFPITGNYDDFYICTDGNLLLIAKYYEFDPIIKNIDYFR